MSKRQNNSSLGVSIGIVIALTLIGFLLLLVIDVLFYTHRLQEQFTNFEQQIANLQITNNELRREQLYVSSPQATDKWAKASQGLAQPGEKVITLSSPKHEATLKMKTEENHLLNNLEHLSPYEQWHLFFFDS